MVNYYFRRSLPSTGGWYTVTPIKKYRFLENVIIGNIQNKIASVYFTTPYLVSEAGLVAATKIEAFVSCVYVWALNGNVELIETSIPIICKLRGDGYVDLYTTNTSLNPQSIINIMLFEGDTI